MAMHNISFVKFQKKVCDFREIKYVVSELLTADSNMLTSSQMNIVFKFLIIIITGVRPEDEQALVNKSRCC